MLIKKIKNQKRNIRVNDLFRVIPINNNIKPNMESL